MRLALVIILFVAACMSSQAYGDCPRVGIKMPEASYVRHTRIENITSWRHCGNICKEVDDCQHWSYFDQNHTRSEECVLHHGNCPGYVVEENAYAGNQACP